MKRTTLNTFFWNLPFLLLQCVSEVHWVGTCSSSAFIFHCYIVLCGEALNQSFVPVFNSHWSSWVWFWFQYSRRGSISERLKSSSRINQLLSGRKSPTEPQMMWFTCSFILNSVSKKRRDQVAKLSLGPFQKAARRQALTWHWLERLPGGQKPSQPPIHLWASLYPKGRMRTHIQVTV